MMSDPYAPPSSAIVEAPRAVVETRWRWLAYFTAALCSLPILVCIQNSVQAGVYLKIAILVYALPWATTCLLLIRLRKSALWSTSFAFVMTTLLSTYAEGAGGFAAIFGFALTMLTLVLWLRNRRALV